MTTMKGSCLLIAAISIAVCGAQTPRGMLPPHDAGATLPSGLSANQIADIDGIANRVLKATGVPSASIAIVKDGHIAYLHAYGLGRLDPPTPATPAMRYAIGSVSKQITAAAMLLLQQDGKLRLDDPVGKYLPLLTHANDITIRMLLTHTSGYPDYWPQDYLMLPMSRPTTTEHILDTWAKGPLDFEPGTKWQYSNTNYVIAAHIIEILTGEPYLNTIERRILTPLGMKSAMNVDNGLAIESGAVGYSRAALGPLRPAGREGAGWMTGAFELAITAEDLARWDISLIDRSLLASSSYDEMFTPEKLKDGSDTHYGLGVETRTIAGHAAIEHSGEATGYVSENIVFPAERAAIVVLTNEMAANAASQTGGDVAPVILQSGASKSASPVVAAEAKALAIFGGLQDGHIDRTMLTSNLNSYFTAQTVGDFSSSLKPLGEPLSFHQTYQTLRGGMTFRVFEAKFPTQTLSVTTYEMPDGKLEQYLVIP
ncbi:MAG TPA: serine hydrolase domain-containing protein [Acidisarcina sp.]